MKGKVVDLELQAWSERCGHLALAAWALECARRVLPLFEEAYPDDHRPRLAVEAGEAWVRGELPMWQARQKAFPAHAAARAALLCRQTAAAAAARAAGQALGVAHVRGHAPYAAEYARKAVLASGGDPHVEWQWQMERLRQIACTGDSD